MFELLEDVLTSPRWHDTKHIANVFRMMTADQMGAVAQSGHSLAMTHAASSLTVLGEQTELQSGLAQIEMLSRLADNFDDVDLGSIFDRMTNHLLREPSLRCMLSADGPDSLDAVQGR